MPHVDDTLVKIAANGLTAEQAAKRAASTSYVARSAESTAASADAKADQAALDYVPLVTLSANYTRLSALTPPVAVVNGVTTTAPPGQVNPTPTVATAPTKFPVVLDNYTLTAAVTVPVSDYFLRVNRNYTAATQSAEAARWDALAARAKVRADARQAYYEWVRALGGLHVAEQTLSVAQAHAKDAKVLFETGSSVAVDVLRADSEVAGAELGIEQAKARRDSTEFALRTIMHAPETEQFEAGEALDENIVAVDAKLPALLKEATEARPEVKSVEENAESARSQAKSARAGRLPALSAFGNVTYANPNPRKFPATDEWFPTWAVGAQLTWSPKDFLTAGTGSADAEARANALEAQRVATREGIMQEVIDAYTATQAADFAVKTTTRQLDSATEAFNVASELYLSGGTTGTTLLEAQGALAKARLDRLNARADARIARVKLDHAVGRDARP